MLYGEGGQPPAAFPQHPKRCCKLGLGTKGLGYPFGVDGEVRRDVVRVRYWYGGPRDAQPADHATRSLLNMLPFLTYTGLILFALLFLHTIVRAGQHF